MPEKIFNGNPRIITLPFDLNRVLESARFNGYPDTLIHFRNLVRGIVYRNPQLGAPIPYVTESMDLAIKNADTVRKGLLGSHGHRWKSGGIKKRDNSETRPDKTIRYPKFQIIHTYDHGREVTRRVRNPAVRRKIRK